jgi:predicted nucleotidyltransferase
MTGVLIASYIFGSVGRQDHDALSDLDILAVVEDGAGLVNEAVVLGSVPAEYRHLQPSISWYGAERLEEMFNNGELFAWHLHDQAKPLFDPDKFLSRMGLPGAYTEAEHDIASFLSILEGIPDALDKEPLNAAFEAGLLFVCLRNIGMAASAVLNDTADFSRYSCLRLSGASPCPLPAGKFDMLMQARMASQRGLAPPVEADDQWVREALVEVQPWLDEVLEKVRT